MTAAKEVLGQRVKLGIDRFPVAQLYRSGGESLRKHELNRLKQTLAEDAYGELKGAMGALGPGEYGACLIDGRNRRGSDERQAACERIIGVPQDPRRTPRGRDRVERPGRARGGATWRRSRGMKFERPWPSRCHLPM